MPFTRDPMVIRAHSITTDELFVGWADNLIYDASLEDATVFAIRNAMAHVGTWTQAPTTGLGGITGATSQLAYKVAFDGNAGPFLYLTDVMPCIPGDVFAGAVSCAYDGGANYA